LARFSGKVFKHDFEKNGRDAKAWRRSWPMQDSGKPKTIKIHPEEALISQIGHFAGVGHTTSP
jgi:hypothetical protein